MNLQLVFVQTIIFVFLSLCACSSTYDKKAESAQDLLNKGIHKIKINAGEQARSAFRQVIEDFPDSKKRIQALLLIARTYYTDLEFEEAKYHFQKFIDLYPTHNQADRAHFFKAMSDYRMIDLAARDQTHTQEALEGFKELINRFPKSQFLKTAKIKYRECELKLAQNILEIGKFYYRTGSYQSAINRLKSLMIDYPRLKYLDEAIYIIAESYYHEQNFDKASATYKKLLKKYPQSKFKLQVKSRLKTLRGGISTMNGR